MKRSYTEFLQDILDTITEFDAVVWATVQHSLPSLKVFVMKALEEMLG